MHSGTCSSITGLDQRACASCVPSRGRIIPYVDVETPVCAARSGIIAGNLGRASRGAEVPIIALRTSSRA